MSFFLHGAAAAIVAFSLCLQSCSLIPLGKEDTFDLAEAADSAADLQDYDEAVQRFTFLLARIESEHRYSPRAYGGLALSLEQQGRFVDARQVRLRELENRLSSKEVRDSDIAWLYCGLADNFLSEGDYENAKKNYSCAMSYFEKRNLAEPWNADTPEFIQSRFYIETGEYDRAFAAVRKKLDLLEKTPSPTFLKQRALIELSRIEMYNSHFAVAEDYLVKVSANSLDAEMEALAAELRGEMYERQRLYEKAMESYERAIAELRADETATYNWSVQIARLLVKLASSELNVDHFESAGAHLREAEQLRHKSGTLGHPDCMDMYLVMARLYVINDDLSMALESVDKSNRILTSSLAPNHPRSAPTLLALWAISEMLSDGSCPVAAQILEEIIDKPLDYWNYSFSTEAHFYQNLQRAKGVRFSKELQLILDDAGPTGR